MALLNEHKLANVQIHCKPKKHEQKTQRPKAWGNKPFEFYLSFKAAFFKSTTKNLALTNVTELRFGTNKFHGLSKCLRALAFDFQDQLLLAFACSVKFFKAAQTKR
jgi:hypothetical protein